MIKHYLKRGAHMTIVYGIATAFTRSINFLFLPYYLSHISLIEFGIWDFYQMIFVNGAVILISIATNSMNRFYLSYKDEPEKQKQSIGNALLLMTSALLIMASAGVTSLLFTQSLFENKLVLITFFNTCLYTLFAFVISYIRVTEQLFLYLILFCGQSLIFVGGTYLGLKNGSGIISFFKASSFSLILFLPAFIILVFKYRTYSWKILKEQIHYCLPLFMYSIIYILFFSFDRIFIKYCVGYETLGTYAVLWRFANIFHLIAFAMIDAWPNILFTADKKNKNLVPGFISLYVMILMFWALLSISFSHLLFSFFLPGHRFLIHYLPLFFLPLLLIELARLFQAGFTLAKKTVPIPFITFTALCCQATFLLFLQQLTPMNIGIILGANSIIYSLFALATAYIGQSYCSTSLYEKRLTKIFILFLIYLLVNQYLISGQKSIFIFGALSISWPISLWFSVVTKKEKLRCKKAFWELNSQIRLLLNHE